MCVFPRHGITLQSVDDEGVDGDRTSVLATALDLAIHMREENPSSINHLSMRESVNTLSLPGKVRGWSVHGRMASW